LNLSCITPVLDSDPMPSAPAGEGVVSIASPMTAKARAIAEQATEIVIPVAFDPSFESFARSTPASAEWLRRSAPVSLGFGSHPRELLQEPLQAPYAFDIAHDLVLRRGDLNGRRAAQLADDRSTVGFEAAVIE
jgi:hypothetical protein